jgi:O-acetyl-ADP-ribose deacetylase (regulator of RNase III)
MDVNLISTSALDLPSSQRVDAIVHDGTIDMKVWPGPGADRELAEAYGSELQSVLDRERTEHGTLPVGGMIRLHRGKLHCDFLLWVGSRPPEKAGIAAPAPQADVLHKAVKEALAFVSERHVQRVAFRTLGAGPNALDDVERIVLIAKASNEYYDECFKAGKPTGIEEVLVCHPHSSKIAAARKLLGRTVKVAEVPAAASPEPKKKERTSRAPSAPRKPGTRKAARTVLSEDDVARAKASAGPYDRLHRYSIGDFFVHPKFGAGRVEELTPEGFIVVLFEGGDSRRLLHGVA